MPRRLLRSSLGPAPVAGRVLGVLPDGAGLGGFGGLGGLGGCGLSQHLPEQEPSLQQQVPFGQAVSSLQVCGYLHSPSWQRPP